jgi:hypothetical protein
MATGTQNIKLTAWRSFIKRNVCKVKQMNDSDNVALLIWYHYCDVCVNSNTTGATIRAGHIFPCLTLHTLRFINDLHAVSLIFCVPVAMETLKQI